MNIIKYFLIVALLIFVTDIRANKKIVKAIEKGNLSEVQAYFEGGNNVNLTIKKKYSYLYYAIKFQQEDICYLLLKEGADPNLIIKKKALLFWAFEVSNIRIARYLIEFGADVNYQDYKKNTALITAAKEANFFFTKMLIERGANPFLINKRKKIAYDYIDYLDNNYTIKRYLKSIHNQITDNPKSANYTDGPYFYWESETEGFLTYYKRLGEQKIVRLYEKTLKFDEKAVWMKGLDWDEKEYFVSRKFKSGSSIIKTDGGVFAMGDIHGNFDGLIQLLINNGIIDDDHNWQFDNGHFVILGDFFDRGAKVTEVLWFLRNLQQQAQENGGDVHVLLGNHELMTMTGDHRYLNPKYRYISQYLNKYYFELFDDNSELGLWLRSLNSIIKINDCLFTHAGISPEFEANKYSLDTINISVRDYLNGKTERVLGSKINNIINGSGPYWYRGYQNPWKLSDELTQDFITNYMNSLNVKHIIIGHNEQQKIVRTLNGRLLSIDVNMGLDGKNAQGLLIENGKMYRCNSYGNKELLNEDDKNPLHSEVSIENYNLN